MAGVRVNLTPISQMSTETFARRMTGAETLSDDQKKQIREQQEVCRWQFVLAAVFVVYAQFDRLWSLDCSVLF